MNNPSFKHAPSFKQAGASPDKPKLRLVVDRLSEQEQLGNSSQGELDIPLFKDINEIEKALFAIQNIAFEISQARNDEHPVINPDSLKRIEDTIDYLRLCKGSANQLVSFVAEYALVRTYSYIDYEYVYEILDDPKYKNEYLEYLQEYGADFFDVENEPVKKDRFKFQPIEPNLNSTEDALPESKWLKIRNYPGMKSFFEEKFGFDLNGISVTAQKKFFEYLGELNSVKSSALLNTIGKIGAPKARADYVEAYIALEMGDEFGSALHNIAENIPEDKLNKLLSSMELLRTGAETMREMFADIAPELAKQANHALVLRCTEMLAVLEELAVHGSVSRRFELNGEEIIISVDSVDEVIDTFEMLGTVFANLSHQLRLEFLMPGTPIKRWDVKEISNGLFLLQRSAARAQSSAVSSLAPGYDARIILRPLGVPYENCDHEYEYNGQARINILVNMGLTTEDGGSHDNDLLVSTEARKNYLSIRFDRETFEYDNLGNPLPETDQPESESGRISLDIGAIADSPGNPNFEIAKILALGNLILSEKRGVLAQLNHVREAFDTSYGDREVFAEIVNDLNLRLTNPKKWLEQRQESST